MTVAPVGLTSSLGLVAIATLDPLPLPLPRQTAGEGNRSSGFPGFEDLELDVSAAAPAGLTSSLGLVAIATPDPLPRRTAGEGNRSRDFRASRIRNSKTWRSRLRKSRSRSSELAAAPADLAVPISDLAGAPDVLASPTLDLAVPPVLAGETRAAPEQPAGSWLLSSGEATSLIEGGTELGGEATRAGEGRSLEQALVNLARVAGDAGVPEPAFAEAASSQAAPSPTRAFVEMAPSETAISRLRNAMETSRPPAVLARMPMPRRPVPPARSFHQKREQPPSIARWVISRLRRLVGF